MDEAVEINFDGIVGPTHSYAGLAFGNLASQKHGHLPSSPRQAALQGLEKMKFLADLGVRQAVLPPQDRPDIGALRRLGFAGSDRDVLETAHRQSPALLAACASASAMWAANAATVSPSSDSADGRMHFTPANLSAQFHRSLETATTAAVLRAIFADESCFVHHEPLAAGMQLADEGAANHTRLSARYGARGIELFTYGRKSFGDDQPPPTRYPARQTCEASQAIARLHQLGLRDVRFIRQNPAAIDAGAFHNDVVAVGNLNVLIYHEKAFAEGELAAANLPDWFEKVAGAELHLIEVKEQLVPLADAISSYMFNSQLVAEPNGRMALVAPAEARENEKSMHFLRSVLAKKTPIDRVHFVDVRQSMDNGGGPACLRLRIVLTPAEISRIKPGVLFSQQLYQTLRQWIEKHYRERLLPDDLADPKLLEESRRALDELTGILGLGAIYPFQRNG